MCVNLQRHQAGRRAVRRSSRRRPGYRAPVASCVGHVAARPPPSVTKHHISRRYTPEERHDPGATTTHGPADDFSPNSYYAEHIQATHPILHSTDIISRELVNEVATFPKIPRPCSSNDKRPQAEKQFADKYFQLFSHPTLRCRIASIGEFSI